MLHSESAPDYGDDLWGPSTESHPDGCVFITTTAMIDSIGHGLPTFTAP